MLIAWLLSLSTVVRAESLPVVTASPAPREAFVCESLLRLAKTYGGWEDTSIHTTLTRLVENAPPELPPADARAFKRGMKLLRRDLERLPDAAFPVKHVIVGEDAIHRYLDDLTAAAGRAERAHAPAEARRPFSFQPRLAAHLTDTLAGLTGSGFSLSLAVNGAVAGQPCWAVGGVLAAAACANQLLAPGAVKLLRSLRNGDLVDEYHTHRAFQYQGTTADLRAEDFVDFAAGATQALERGMLYPGRVLWLSRRIRVPMSASERPAQRAPGANELAVAIRRSGDFRLPFDAREIHVDFLLFRHEQKDEPIVMGFVREP